MVYGILIDNKFVRNANINECINKDKCVSCKNAYKDIVLITKTGIGFCSKECMEQFNVWNNLLQNGEKKMMFPFA